MMNIIYITLDYELFLGNDTGTIDHCLIRPMNELCIVAKKYNISFTIFVDAAYLYCMKRFNKNQQIKKDYDIVCANINHLKDAGHDIQLHIHPQWFYAYWDNGWKLPQSFYKLADLPESEVSGLFKTSKELLEEIIQDEVIAFRAGGFSAQPTSLLKKLFIENNIKIDSSVYSKSFYNSDYQSYDYSKCPDKDVYRFDSDICIEDNRGKFIELPISTYNVSPLIYWKYVFSKLTKSKKHLIYGDGNSVPLNKNSIIKRLTQATNGLATIDGIKICYLKSALQTKINSNDKHFCILGHPKLVTPYSLRKLDLFCKDLPIGCSFSSIKNLHHLYVEL